MRTGRGIAGEGAGWTQEAVGEDDEEPRGAASPSGRVERTGGGADKGGGGEGGEGG